MEFWRASKLRSGWRNWTHRGLCLTTTFQSAGFLLVLHKRLTNLKVTVWAYMHHNPDQLGVFYFFYFLLYCFLCSLEDTHTHSLILGGDNIWGLKMTGISACLTQGLSISFCFSLSLSVGWSQADDGWTSQKIWDGPNQGESSTHVSRVDKARGRRKVWLRSKAQRRTVQEENSLASSGLITSALTRLIKEKHFVFLVT